MAASYGGRAELVRVPRAPASFAGGGRKAAAFVGAEGCDIVFVENATTGCNAVLRPLRLAAGTKCSCFRTATGGAQRGPPRAERRERGWPKWWCRAPQVLAALKTGHVIPAEAEINPAPNLPI